MDRDVGVVVGPIVPRQGMLFLDGVTDVLFPAARVDGIAEPHDMVARSRTSVSRILLDHASQAAKSSGVERQIRRSTRAPFTTLRAPLRLFGALPDLTVQLPGARCEQPGRRKRRALAPCACGLVSPGATSMP